MRAPYKAAEGARVAQLPGRHPMACVNANPYGGATAPARCREIKPGDWYVATRPPAGRPVCMPCALRAGLAAPIEALPAGGSGARPQLEMGIASGRTLPGQLNLI